MKTIILIILLPILAISQAQAQRMELSEYLKNYSSLRSKHAHLVISGPELKVARDYSIPSKDESSSFGIGNRQEIDPEILCNYLKENGFRIDFVSERTDQNGNLYAYFNYDTSYWVAWFSCGSRGCGVEFVLLEND